ncbi:MAG: 6-bladed beta-propeller [Burkholderiaceae bacterium]|nr:6-bladed beta-propeller [Burkholderiaceae bacterium]
MIRSFKACVAGMALLLLAGGCVAPAPTGDDAVARASLVWPKPPATPRIRYLQSVSGAQDWGIERSWLRRLADVLTGTGAEQFVRPSAVAEADGVLYVADPGARSLWILDRPRNRATRLTQIGNEPLVSPVALALRADGAVFVADTALKKIFLLDRDGALIRTITSQALERPAGLAWDEGARRLYVIDSVRHRITVFDVDGAFVRHIGEVGQGDGQFNHPTHIALDAGGALLVTDTLNFRLQTMSRDGRFIRKFGHAGNGAGDFAAPKGVAVDADAHYYVVDALFDAVQIFDKMGQLLLGFGEHGEHPGQFTLPRGIFISTEDKVYVADAYNHRVQVFQGAVATGKEQIK